MADPTTANFATGLPAPRPVVVPRAPATLAALTIAEHTVLHLLACGRSNAQIGQCLGRSEKTIRNRLTRIYTKLGVANRAEAVAVHMRMEFERAR